MQCQLCPPAFRVPSQALYNYSALNYHLRPSSLPSNRPSMSALLVSTCNHSEYHRGPLISSLTAQSTIPGPLFSPLTAQSTTIGPLFSRLTGSEYHHMPSRQFSNSSEYHQGPLTAPGPSIKLTQSTTQALYFFS